ncbi:hypothetical protein Baya_4847 [Bagarius yarrelli]|uniref:Uncharacterized protein n=1 Tax=Bagarius yarrelli TaxID=175774 RepID=A0A556TRQ6_BAGYA|nr:hypothetical protein Baya_4847 [Bagarius yarrelli]
MERIGKFWDRGREPEPTCGWLANETKQIFQVDYKSWGLVNRLHSNKHITAQQSSVYWWLGKNGVIVAIPYHAQMNHFISSGRTLLVDSDISERDTDATAAALCRRRRQHMELDRPL